jgi:hypothetical protein
LCPRPLSCPHSRDSPLAVAFTLAPCARPCSRRGSCARARDRAREQSLIVSRHCQVHHFCTITVSVGLLEGRTCHVCAPALFQQGVKQLSASKAMLHPHPPPFPATLSRTTRHPPRSSLHPSPSTLDLTPSTHHPPTSTLHPYTLICASPAIACSHLLLNVPASASAPVVLTSSRAHVARCLGQVQRSLFLIPP